MENKYKIIIIALIVIIVALLVGMFATMSTVTKQDTNLTFKGKSKLTEGDSLKVKLADVNGTALSNQTVNITITEKNDTKSYYSLKTNKNGTATLKLEKSPGKYNITVKFGGNKKYNACYATKRITIEEKVVEAQTTASSASSSSNYDPGAYYSLQSHKTYYTGDIVKEPGGNSYVRHLGNNMWEPI